MLYWASLVVDCPHLWYELLSPEIQACKERCFPGTLFEETFNLPDTGVHNKYNSFIFVLYDEFRSCQYFIPQLECHDNNHWVIIPEMSIRKCSGNVNMKYLLWNVLSPHKAAIGGNCCIWIWSRSCLADRYRMKVRYEIYPQLYILSDILVHIYALFLLDVHFWSSSMVVFALLNYIPQHVISWVVILDLLCTSRRPYVVTWSLITMAADSFLLHDPVELRLPTLVFLPLTTIVMYIVPYNFFYHLSLSLTLTYSIWFRMYSCFDNFIDASIFRESC